MSKIRWLHLSDFHIGKERYEQKILCKEIVNFTQKLKQQNKEPDLIFITGDLANWGIKDEYSYFNDKFLLRLLDVLGNDYLDRILTIPGNHDVDRKKAEDVDAHTVMDRLPNYLYPEPESLAKRKHLLERFEGFIQNDWSNKDIPERHWMNSSQGYYTKEFNIRDVSVGIVGINTAWLSQDDYDKGFLNPGDDMLKDGLEKIAHTTVRIVLGHHPLDWLKEPIENRVKTFLGKYGAIYLHGHLHKNQMNFEYGAGYPFLALQAGAAYQTRDDPIWRNRILNCELDIEENTIIANPLQWSREYDDWTTDSEAFPPRFKDGDRSTFRFPLPKQNEVFPGETATFDVKLLPQGWTLIDKEFLSNHRKEIAKEQLTFFFNGKNEPNWTEILSGKVPHREMVHEIFELLTQLKENDPCRVVAVLGAGGEGKSTIIKQVVCELAQKTFDWKIIWHDNAEKSLPVSETSNFPQTNDTRWLIVSDYASSILSDVNSWLNLAKDRKDIYFLLSSRLADWRAENGDAINWGTKLKRITLRGLSIHDANAIVNAWEDAKALEELGNIEPDQRAQQLFDYAREESNETEGAFLGAMLRARKGKGFEKHIKELLSKLKEIKITKHSDTSLLDVFAHIVYMHIDGFDFLSKAVLAEAFGVKLEEVRKNIIIPLGDEVAQLITTSGKYDRYVQTRHLAIAQAAGKVLNSDYGFDRIVIYSKLLTSARQIWRNFGSSMSDADMKKWTDMPFHFFNQGDLELSFHLIKTLRDMLPERTNPVFVVDHAHLYRKSEQYSDSIRIFREAPSYIHRDRAFFTEWGVAERLAKHHYLSVYLLATALADGVSMEREREVTNERAHLSLNALLDTLKELNDPNLETMTESIRYLLKRTSHPSQHISNATLDNFKNGVRLAWDRREDQLPAFIPDASALVFNSFSRSLGIR